MANSSHKLDTRSQRCVFVGYPSNFRGYRCLNLTTGKTILSRHVIFNESAFPYSTSLPPPDHSFLEDDISPIFTQPTVSTSPTSTRTPPIIYTYHRRNPQTSNPPTAPTVPASSQPDCLTSRQPPFPAAPTVHPAPTHPNHTSPPTQQPIHPSVTAAHPSSESNRTHPMLTRSQTGHLKPSTPLNLHTSTISPLPTSPSKALSDPHWRAAMYDNIKP